MTIEEHYMSRCIALARKGETGAPPNPMVGAVLVCDGKIIGEGFHRRCGGPHAEVNAFASVRRPELVEKSTLYVSLEPCAHYGRTPPCAELIIKKKVGRVVIGCRDPFVKVQGRGVAMLREAGIDVLEGVLEKECKELNKRFFTCQTQHRPYITLKWAQSADGFMAPCVKPNTSVYISTPHTLLRVHRLRALHQAILVGTNTTMIDNPSLTLRAWAGKQPLRVVLDRHGVLPASLHIFDGEVPTLIVGEKNPRLRAARGTYDFLRLREGQSVFQCLFDELLKRGVQSLLVEGGRKLLQSFIQDGLWDEAHVEIGDVCFGDGLPAPMLPSGMPVSVEECWEHTIVHYLSHG